MQQAPAMAGMIPTWTLTGVVTEKRDLETKAGKVWAHSLSVMAFGGVYELTTKNPKLYAGVGDGETVTCTGTFESYQGRLKLVCQTCEPAHSWGGVGGSAGGGDSSPRTEAGKGGKS